MSDIDEEEGYDMPDNPLYTPEEDGPAERPVVTAFLVLVEEDGSALATSDLNLAASLVLERGATPGDMYRASVEVQKDIQGMEYAHRVQQVMMATAQAVAQAQQDQEQHSQVSRLLQQGLRPS
jgi:hypothetical protein